MGMLVCSNAYFISTTANILMILTTLYADMAGLYAGNMGMQCGLLAANKPNHVNLCFSQQPHSKPMTTV